MAGSDVTVFSPKNSRPPPPSTVGVVGWLRSNLFYSWFSTILTFSVLYLIYLLVAFMYDWGIANAVFEAETRRECLDQSPEGACWPGVISWFNAFIYGRYPVGEQWRIDLAFLTLILWVLPFWLPRVTAKVGIGISAVLIFPFLAGYLFSGGERGWLMQFMVCLAVTAFISNWLHTILCLLSGKGLNHWILQISGFAKKHDSQHKYPMIAYGLIVFIIVYFQLSGWQVEAVDTTLWGGLFLTIVIAGIGITSALPAGIVLALARRSNMPVIRVISVAFIELFRSVPLITVLFMAVTMMPLFLPEGFQLNKLVQAIIGVCLFAAAYMAEIVRGGLQAIPKGQYEAAQAMGLNYWKMMALIVMPQALKMMIPNIVGNFIGLFKDTTLVSIIGLYDLLLMLRAVGQNPTWNGLHKEPLIFGAVVFFIACFAMSKYSQHLERKLGQGSIR